MKKKVLNLYVVMAALLFAIMSCSSSGDGSSGGDPLDTSDYISENIGILKYVPFGTFQRDSTSTNTSYVSAFRMSVYEITRAQFQNIMGTDPSTVANSSGTNDPVQNVNWYHAIAFCNKLSLEEGLTPVYAVSGVNFNTLTYSDIPTNSNSNWNSATATWTNNGYRLPTEMEWMWAAMGATSDRTNGYTGIGTNTTGYQKEFAGSTGSNQIGDYAVFGYGSGETGATTTSRSNPVGSKTDGANELGLFDMSGNVWEWCWDCYGEYPTGERSDYRGLASGVNRVELGGCWIGVASSYSLDARHSNSSDHRSNYLGFRVVRSSQ